MAMYCPTGALPSAPVAHTKLLRCPRTMPVMPAHKLKLAAEAGPSHGCEPTCKYQWLVWRGGGSSQDGCAGMQGLL